MHNGRLIVHVDKLGKDDGARSTWLNKISTFHTLFKKMIISKVMEPKV